MNNYEHLVRLGNSISIGFNDWSRIRTNQRCM